MNTTQELHIVTAENAPRIAHWISNRGGLAIWESVNLSNPGASWTTPAQNLDGIPMSKPNWQCSDQPARIITNPAEVTVSTDVECKRFRVGIRMGGNSLTWKVTDGGSRRIRREVAKAGIGAYHVFDFAFQEAVIMRPAAQIPLPEFLQKVAETVER